MFCTTTGGQYVWHELASCLKATTGTPSSINETSIVDELTSFITCSQTDSSDINEIKSMVGTFLPNVSCLDMPTDPPQARNSAMDVVTADGREDIAIPSTTAANRNGQENGQRENCESPEGTGPAANLRTDCDEKIRAEEYPEDDFDNSTINSCSLIGKSLIFHGEYNDLRHDDDGATIRTNYSTVTSYKRKLAELQKKHEHVLALLSE
jgi:hypothetical protein